MGSLSKVPTEKWNTACHVSQQRMSQAEGIAATTRPQPPPASELVSPEELRKEKNNLPFGNQQTAVIPHGEPRGNSGCENTGSWPYISKLHIKGMISVNPDCCIFSYLEKC